MSVEIIHGDSRIALEFMPSNSVHCIVTSPPYWGLRDYGTGRWEGGDPNCDHRSPTMREGRNENRQKLAGSSATNSYQNILAHNLACGKCGAVKVDQQIGLEASVDLHIQTLVDLFREARRVLRDDGTLWLNYGDAYASTPNGISAAATKAKGNDDRTFRDKPISTVGGVLKPKDRMLLPARLAIALQADGWWVRDEIIWHKPNPMPSSVKDRTTPAHEMIYMLSKKSRYYFDQEAILEPVSPNTYARLSQDVQNQVGSMRANGGTKSNGPMKAVSRKVAEPGSGVKNNSSFDAAMAIMPTMRNPRSVWTIAPKGFKEAHFATFPPDLIKPCILAGCPEGGTVLDPFFGAGTTGLVAQQLGRNCIGVELNADYIDIAKRRLGLSQPEDVFS